MKERKKAVREMQLTKRELDYIADYFMPYTIQPIGRPLYSGSWKFDPTMLTWECSSHGTERIVIPLDRVAEFIREHRDRAK